MKRKAFTLVELLITALVLVVVAGYSVVILSSTVALNAQAQRSTGAAGQSRQAIDTISRAFSQSSTSLPVAVLPGVGGTDQNQTSNVLIFSVTIPDNSGAPTAATEQRIYCVSPVTTGYRLAEFVSTGTYTGSVSSLACNSAAIATAFAGGSVTGPSYLTDAVTNVKQFQAIVSYYGSTTPNASPSSTNPSVHLVLTTNYDQTIGNPAATDRVDNGGTAHAITVEATASRNFAYNRLPFSGL